MKKPSEQNYYKNTTNMTNLKGRGYYWDILLEAYKQHNKVLRSPQEIYEVKLDLPNQGTVKKDALRTRSNIYNEQLQNKQEMMLTYYCKKNNIPYKQGLNEVAAPFIYFSTVDLSLDTIYNYFNTFMNRYIPTLHRDPDFKSLECYFRLLSLLIQYHDPELFELLDQNDINPELYSMSWFMTLFANKLSIDLVYLFWEIYIVQDDPYLVFFIALSLIIQKRQELLLGDPLFLPQVLTNLSIDSIDELKKVFKTAMEKRYDTPISFFSKIEQLKLFDKSHKNFEKSLKQLQNIQALQLYPTEILSQIYPKIILCPNMFCPKNTPLIQHLKHYQKYSISPQTCFICHKQSDNNENNKIKENVINSNNFLKDLVDIANTVKSQQNSSIQFLKLDFRKEKSNGILPLSSPIEMQEYQEEISLQIQQDYENCNGKQHICFFVEEFLQNSQKMTLDSNNNNNSQDQYDDEMENLENEKCIIRLVSEDFQKNLFKKISILEGGFKDCHDILLSQKIDINGHQRQKCSLCNKKSINNKKQPQSESILDMIANVFSFNTSQSQQQQQQQQKLKQQQQQQQQRPSQSRSSSRPSLPRNTYTEPHNNNNNNNNSNIENINPKPHHYTISNSQQKQNYQQQQQDPLPLQQNQIQFQQQSQLLNQPPISSTQQQQQQNYDINSKEYKQFNKQQQFKATLSPPIKPKIPNKSNNNQNQPLQSQQNQQQQQQNININQFDIKIQTHSQQQQQQDYPNHHYSNSKYSHSNNKSYQQNNNNNQLKKHNNNSNEPLEQIPNEDEMCDHKHNRSSQKHLQNIPLQDQIQLEKLQQQYLQKQSLQQPLSNITNNASQQQNKQHNQSQQQQQQNYHHHRTHTNSHDYSSTNNNNNQQNPKIDRQVPYWSPCQPGMEKQNSSQKLQQNQQENQQLPKSSRNFKKRGLFSTIKITKDKFNIFFDCFVNNPFLYYTCNQLKDKNSNYIHLQQQQMKQGSNNLYSQILYKRIIVVTQDFIMCLKYEQFIEDTLKSILQNSRKHSFNPSEFSHLPIQTTLKISSFYFMKTLLKITSKKVNGNILSFYYKVPNPEHMNKIKNSKYYQFINKFSVENLRQIILTQSSSKIMNEFSQYVQSQDKIEIKCLFDLEQERKAIECIKVSKEFYTQCIQNVSQNSQQRQQQQYKSQHQQQSQTKDMYKK